MTAADYFEVEVLLDFANHGEELWGRSEIEAVEEFFDVDLEGV
ncbi:hypothetical protein [Micromonospora sp. NPDC049240]